MDVSPPRWASRLASSDIPSRCGITVLELLLENSPILLPFNGLTYAALRRTCLGPRSSASPFKDTAISLRGALITIGSP